jgi:hypothetical protein
LDPANAKTAFLRLVGIFPVRLTSVMPSAFDAAFAEVRKLVANFQANAGYYLSPGFSEAQARKDFIDKFFIAPGWDVSHDTQKNPCEQEVKIEKNESGTQRRPGNICGNQTGRLRKSVNLI